MRVIYGCHMSGSSQQTTVYLDVIEYRRLKSLASQRGRAPAMLVREAVAEYVTRHTPAMWPKSIGSGASELQDLAACGRPPS